MNKDNIICWFENQLLKKFEEPLAVIIIGNAYYHIMFANALKLVYPIVKL